jgi:hypothetical protein
MVGKFNVLTQSCNTINMEGHIEVVVVKFFANMVHNISYLRAKIFKYNSICWGYKNKKFEFSYVKLVVVCQVK